MAEQNNEMSVYANLAALLDKKLFLAREMINIIDVNEHEKVKKEYKNTMLQIKSTIDQLPKIKSSDYISSIELFEGSMAAVKISDVLVKRRRPDGLLNFIYGLTFLSLLGFVGVCVAIYNEVEGLFPIAAILFMFTLSGFIAAFFRKKKLSISDTTLKKGLSFYKRFMDKNTYSDFERLSSEFKKHTIFH